MPRFEDAWNDRLKDLESLSRTAAEALLKRIVGYQFIGRAVTVRSAGINMLSEIPNLVAKLATVNEEISKQMEQSYSPIKRYPASDDQIRRVEQALQVELPKQYVDFLKYSDGYPFISTSYHLLGTPEFINKDYIERLKVIRDDFSVEDFPEIHLGFPFAWDDETQTLGLFLVKSHNPGSIYLWDPDFPEKHADFKSFLESELKGAESVLKILLEVAE